MNEENFITEEIKNNKPTFTGVWIPAEILLDERLKSVDKILYAEIASYGANGCYRKRDELMTRLGVKERAFNASTKRLREYGYISERRFFGRIVRTTTLGFQNAKNDENSENPKKAKKSPKIEQNSKNDQKPEKTVKVSKNAEKSLNSGDFDTNEQEDFENRKNKAIDMMFKYWEQELGFAQKQSKANRYACYNMLISRNKGKNWIAEMIVYLKMAKADRYSGIKINNYADLQRDYEKLFGWATSKVAQTATAEIVVGENGTNWLE